MSKMEESQSGREELKNQSGTSEIKKRSGVVKRKKQIGAAETKSRSGLAGKIICGIAIICSAASLVYSGIEIVKLRKAQNLRDSIVLDEYGSYTSREDVAAYIYKYGHLPANFMTKLEADLSGWIGGSLDAILPGKVIGGDRIYEEYNKSLAVEDITGRYYRECDINNIGKAERGSERLIYSNDGMIYYTPDHYKSVELLYDGR